MFLQNMFSCYLNCQTATFYQIFSILAVCLLNVTNGVFIAWMSPSVPKLLENPTYETTLEDISYLTIIVPLAGVIGSITASYALDKFGRKWTILAANCPFALGWIILTQSRKLIHFYIAHFVAALGTGILLVSVPAYVTEISSSSLREFWTNVSIISIYFGQLLINAVGGHLSIDLTAYIFLAYTLASALVFVFAAETPYFLLLRNRSEEAGRTMGKLEGNVDVDAKLAAMTSAAQDVTSDRTGGKRADNQEVEVAENPGSNCAKKKETKEGYLSLIQNKIHRKSLFLVAFVKLAPVFSGVITLTLYTQYIFNRSGGDLSAVTSSVIFSAALIAATSVSAFVLRALGKRKSFLVSCAGCACALWAETAYFYLDKRTTDLESEFSESYSWVCLLGMIVYIVFYSIGLAPVPAVLPAELFALSVRAKGLAVANLLFVACAMSTNKLFDLLEGAFGLYSVFLFYAVCTTASSFASFFLVPETTGKTLEEIQDMLNGRT